jgi:hypothetical protein
VTYLDLFHGLDPAKIIGAQREWMDFLAITAAATSCRRPLPAPFPPYSGQI